MATQPTKATPAGPQKATDERKEKVGLGWSNSQRLGLIRRLTYSTTSLVLTPKFR